MGTGRSRCRGTRPGIAMPDLFLARGSRCTSPGLSEHWPVMSRATMGMGLWRGRSDLAPAGTALLVGLVATQFAPAIWVIVASGLSGPIATYLLHGQGR